MEEVTLPEQPPVPEALLRDAFSKMAADARTANFSPSNWFTAGATMAEQWMREFARAAVLMERERCAKVCDKETEIAHGEFGAGWIEGARACAAAIRKGE